MSAPTGTAMLPFKVRQSDLSTWAKCPLMYKYQHIDKLPREQSASLTFGSIIHDIVMEMELRQDVEWAVKEFIERWIDPVGYMGPEYKIDYYVRGTNWKKYLAEGERMIRDWWGIIRWDADVTLAREYHFEVPIGNGHVLEGTIDKLVIRQVPKLHTNVVLISDYKTNSKTPTYDWLEDNLQFTAYAYATTRPEFWAGLPNGAVIEKQVEKLPRWGEWVSLKGPKRLDAGERTQVQYNRLTMAVNALAESVAMRIFVPNISGENCRYCEFRAQCGLREVPDTEW